MRVQLGNGHELNVPDTDAALNAMLAPFIEATRDRLGLGPEVDDRTVLESLASELKDADPDDDLRGFATMDMLEGMDRAGITVVK
jgi:hypothetical protein